MTSPDINRAYKGFSDRPALASLRKTHAASWFRYDGPRFTESVPTLQANSNRGKPPITCCGIAKSFPGFFSLD